MKNSKNYIILVAAFVLLVSCKKEKEITVTAHIYGGDSVDLRPLSVFVNGEYKGVIPNDAQLPLTCGQQGLDTLALTFLLKGGDYTFVVKNGNGKQVHKSSCKFSENSISGACSQGSQEVTKSGDCLLVKLETDTVSLN